MAAALQLLDLLADGAGFFFGVPRAGDGDFLAQLVVGAQRLAEPAFVVGDDVRGGGEDVAGRAVIALQPDHFCAGKVVLEAQNVVDLGAAPAVDRLIVVADAADVFRREFSPRHSGRAVRREPGIAYPRRQGLWISGLAASRRPGMTVVAAVEPLRQQPQPQILRHVGVLVFIDQNEFEAALILRAAPRVARGTAGCIRATNRRSRRR